ncbi:MAG: ribonuclease HII [Blastocatellia bacterium]
MQYHEDLSHQPVSRLRARFFDHEEPMPSGALEALENDSRASARRLAARLRARMEGDLAEDMRLRALLKFEGELWARGFDAIAGVDEAGVGPMAGPVVAGAVVLPRNFALRELNDSKKLDEAMRERLAERIRAEAVAWAVGVAEVEEIDRVNIYQAGLRAMRRAVEGLSARPDFVLVDARTIPECPAPQRGIIRGDSLSASIAAASIIAKTARDRTMFELDREYPGYGFAAHKGYPTPEHFRTLRELGVSPVHRRSYRPVREVLGLEPARSGLFAPSDG